MNPELLMLLLPHLDRFLSKFLSIEEQSEIVKMLHATSNEHVSHSKDLIRTMADMIFSDGKDVPSWRRE